MCFYIINLNRKPQEGGASVDNGPLVKCDSLRGNDKMLHQAYHQVDIDYQHRGSTAHPSMGAEQMKLFLMDAKFSSCWS